ncbi:MAG TPA: hypothetical protein VFM05_03830 [Candidatus Saccharimonadales bacterium]|nr:hypothetical protein [Candidatus Saccharimonadales bacterium]
MTIPEITITQTVTIGAGASLSGASTKYAGYRLVGIITASTWDAAKVSFSVSVDGTNYFTLHSGSAEYEIASVTGAFAIPVEKKYFMPWNYVKVRSGTSGAATNQADATVVTLVFMAM